MRARGRRQRQLCGGRDCNRRMGQFLDPALLLLLEQSPAHGYTLLNRMAEFGLDFLAPTVIYRALREMEDRGWVTSTIDEEETQGPPRRVYALAPAGRAILACCIAQLKSTQQVLEYVLALHDELAPDGVTLATDPTFTHEEVSMRVVIPANGADLDAPTSPIFGRSQMFILVDPETLAFEALPNPALDAPGGAGVQAAQTVLQHGVSAVIAPSLGPNAFRVVQAAGIPAYRMAGATVREVITAFNAGQLARLETPGDDHVGIGGGRHRGGRG
ncbi:MAG TPA: NifB/NifX family molybdenum-iron cluster-binding protein [Anaerolineae bacterium]|nr:NifB/NifX family molybdenum-iron cluster-binding protein [Anaerolineae bacterium]HQI86370.1 NifB/NifX family molybdenum-iron cluster-binding protein [Anaerolineae bacterium]